MIITITASLAEEQSLLLAKEKWYQENISTVVDMNIIPSEIISSPNPETPYEFLKKVYEAMIINDAQKHFIEAFDRRIKEENEATREMYKEQVVNSITSSVI